MTINIKMGGFREVKDKLSNIESQIDRILIKQKQLYNLSYGTGISQPGNIKCPGNNQAIDLGKVTADGIDIEQFAEQLNSYMKICRDY